MKEGVERIRQLVEQWSPEDLLRWAFVTFGGYVEIASGFGPEGVVLIDIAARVQPLSASSPSTPIFCSPRPIA